MKNPLRVIAHCDVDAAYAQFEARRLGLNCFKEPVAVLQWNGLIAVNYVARKSGLSRFNDTPEECMRKCPDLKLIHVATYGPGDTEPQYHENPSALTHKISLDLYRRESKHILRIFQYRVAESTELGANLGSDLQSWQDDGSVWPHALVLEGDSTDSDIIVEKASIDESFFDLSVYARKQMLVRFPFLDVRETDVDLDTELPPLPLSVREELNDAAWGHLGAWDGDDEHSAGEATWLDVAIAMGAERLIAVRKHVLDVLGYTTSAGVAENKALAKLCASHRKPCNQTVLRPRAVNAFLRHLPFQSIRMLGGKLGAAIADEWNFSRVGELWDVSLEQMQGRFGRESAWMHDYVRGIDLSEVSSRTANNSMLSSKNFRPGISSNAKGLYWISIMAAELCLRMQEERKECPSLYPRTLVMKYVILGAPSARSVQVPFGYHTSDELLPAAERAGSRLWCESVGAILDKSKAEDEVFVINLLLGFTGIDRQADGQKRIETFFSAGQKRKVSAFASSSPTADEKRADLANGTARAAGDSTATVGGFFAGAGVDEPSAGVGIFEAPLTTAAHGKLPPRGIDKGKRRSDSSAESVVERTPLAAGPSRNAHTGSSHTGPPHFAPSRARSNEASGTIEWACARCDHALSIPLIDDGSHDTMLMSLSTEHLDWHMAMEMADT